jgi:hypothetical protein
MYACMYVYVYVCVSIYTYIDTLCIKSNSGDTACMYVCMYVCTCISGIENKLS